MSFVPKTIKPVRSQDASPELKKTRAIKNALQGIETSLVLDLNILSAMNSVLKNKITYKDSGLKPLVKFLNETPGLCLTPGFAIKEVQDSFLREITESFDRFLLKYCSGYQDHPNATKNFLKEKINPSTFKELSQTDQYMNSVAYLGILRTQLIAREYAAASDTEKFTAYVNYMVSKANILGAIETEAAKYVFFDGRTLTDQKLISFCKTIKNNFKKSANTPEKLLQKCFNAARDIMYYRLTANINFTEIDGRRQDNWLITGDEGLANLAKSIYFTPTADGTGSGEVCFVRHAQQETSEYWRFCDNLQINAVEYRQLTGFINNDEPWSDKDFKKLLSCISDTEQKLTLQQG